MTKFNFLCAIATLNDLLPHLSKLSLIFQKKLVDLSVISCFVNATIAVIQQRLPSHEKVYSDAEDMAKRLREATNITITITGEAKNPLTRKFAVLFLLQLLIT